MTKPEGPAQEPQHDHDCGCAKCFVAAEGKYAWRVGRKVPINVYEGDRPVCQCQTALDAKKIVAAVNAAMRQVPATPAPSQPAGVREFEQHTKAVGEFLNELYATMVDPCEQPQMTVAEMCDLLIKTAREHREIANNYAQQTAAKDAEHDTHIAEFQQAVYETCKAIARECGQSDHAIDGAGSDGDEIEFTVTEVKQAFNLLRDAKEAAVRERDSWRESAKYWCRLAEAGEREIERLRRERTEEQLKAGKDGHPPPHPDVSDSVLTHQQVEGTRIYCIQAITTDGDDYHGTFHADLTDEQAELVRAALEAAVANDSLANYEMDVVTINSFAHVLAETHKLAYGEPDEEEMSDKRVHTAPSNPRILADKPAATVHGTGNGEAKDWFESMPSLSDVPTPPASPTVTLDRIDHAFESAISALAWLPQDGPIRKRTAEVVDELRAARQELALLRAAERQK